MSEKGEKPMLKAGDIMTKEVIAVHPETEIVQAARLLLDRLERIEEYLQQLAK